MPGDRRNPVDGKIVVIYGKTKAQGDVVDLTIREVKVMFALQAPQSRMPLNAVARIATMDPEDAAWKALPSTEERVMLTLPTQWGLQIFQAVAKIVPDTYKVRSADICLEFTDPAKAGDPPKAP